MSTPYSLEALEKIYHEWVNTTYRGPEEYNPGLTFQKAPAIPDLDSQVLELVHGQPAGWMDTWHSTNGKGYTTHSCGTAHCLAGWASVLAGQALGFTPKEMDHLEDELDIELWAAAIWIKSTGSCPKFFQTDSEALAEMRGRAAVP